MRRVDLRVLAAVAVQLGVGGEVAAQVQQVGAPRALTLAEALRTAEDQSEQVEIARAAVLRARGQRLQARSEMYPQIGAQASYTRTLASEFEGAFGGGAPADSASGPPAPACQPFVPDPTLPVEQRVGLLEAQLTCDDSPFAGLDFSNLPFGRENVYRVGLSVSQNLFAGGRLAAQNRIARSGVEVAEIALEQARAGLQLEVTQAYYDAVLSDRLLVIADASLQQAERTLRQAQLARQVGTQPEFELLRAQVSRDNLRPVLIQRQADRDLAYLRLRQLLNLPPDQEVELISDLDDEELAPTPRFAVRVTDQGVEPVVDTTVVRAVVRQAEQAVEVQQQLLAVTQSQRLPSLMLVSQYGRVAYPSSALPEFGDTRENWTVGVSLSVPVFTGGRLRGEKLVAQANLLEARSRLQQVREMALLDTRSAYEQLAAALAAWQASTGTVDQASRAYQIAEVRYREGISTQVELSDSRILLQQAQANRALAARNVQIARSRVALLPYLPLGSGSSAGGGAGAQPEQRQQQPQPRRQQPGQQGGDASFTSF